MDVGGGPAELRAGTRDGTFRIEPLDRCRVDKGEAPQRIRGAPTVGAVAAGERSFAAHESGTFDAGQNHGNTQEERKS